MLFLKQPKDLPFEVSFSTSLEGRVSFFKVCLREHFSFYSAAYLFVEAGLGTNRGYCGVMALKSCGFYNGSIAVFFMDVKAGLPTSDAFLYNDILKHSEFSIPSI